jgi:hypothetical protein
MGMYVTEVTECLSSKFKAVSSNPTTAKKTQKMQTFYYYLH